MPLTINYTTHYPLHPPTHPPSLSINRSLRIICSLLMYKMLQLYARYIHAWLGHYKSYHDDNNDEDEDVAVFPTLATQGRSLAVCVRALGRMGTSFHALQHTYASTSTRTSKGATSKTTTSGGVDSGSGDDNRGCGLSSVLTVVSPHLTAHSLSTLLHGFTLLANNAPPPSSSSGCYGDILASTAILPSPSASAPHAHGQGAAPAAQGQGLGPAAQGQGLAPAAQGQELGPAAQGQGLAPAAHGQELGLDRSNSLHMSSSSPPSPLVVLPPTIFRALVSVRDTLTPQGVALVVYALGKLGYSWDQLDVMSNIDNNNNDDLSGKFNELHDKDDDDKNPSTKDKASSGASSGCSGVVVTVTPPALTLTQALLSAIAREAPRMNAQVQGQLTKPSLSYPHSSHIQYSIPYMLLAYPLTYQSINQSIIL